ncbi:MAG TPA: hypothetical protein VJN18_32175 [Polyangiaceae bacterium]|nr:hypothetical protein [Polyangiaceae bacterium]
MTHHAPGYYVSAIDGPRRALMAGPFGSHDEAKAAVDPTKAAAVAALALGGRAWFAALGTARVRPEGEPAPLQRRRIRLPLFEPPPSECRFRVYVRGSGQLRCVQAGRPHPGKGWVEIAKVTMPRKAWLRAWYDESFNGYKAACDSLFRVYRGLL